MKETLTLLPVSLTLFGGGDGSAGGPAVGSGPTTWSGPAAGSGPATGSGPTTGAPPLPVPPPGAQQGAQTGAVIQPGPGPQAGVVPGPPPAVPQAGAAPQPGPAPTVGALLAQRQLRAWNEQAEEVKTLYPGFDLSQEARDRTFRSLLRSGVPVRQAFEVLHMDELRSAAERAVTANIRAKGARPQENGAGASSGFTVKDDVSHLTPRDRAELAKRAARGEVITF